MKTFENIDRLYSPSFNCKGGLNKEGGSVFCYKFLSGEGVNKWLTRLRLGLSHLHEHKFKHNFQDTINPFCYCRQEIETTTHFLLHCPQYSNNRTTFLNKIKSLINNFQDKNDLALTNLLLYGDMSLSTETNKSILNSTIDFLLETRRFADPLLWQ